MENNSSQEKESLLLIPKLSFNQLNEILSYSLRSNWEDLIK
jgi:hypothetical protein